MDTMLKRISQLSPNLQTILLSLRDDDELLSQLPQIMIKKGFDWEGMKQLADQKGVFCFLYQKLLTVKKGTIPVQVFDSYKKLYFTRVSKNLTLANQLIKICQLLEHQNIQYFPFKGPILSKQAYSNEVLRKSDDLDFIIDPKDVIPCWDLFIKNNFIPTSINQTKVIKYIQRTQRDFGMVNNHLHLDIHQQIAKGPPFFTPDPEIWDSNQHTEINSANIPTLKIEETLVYLGIHCAKDGFTSLKLFHDLAHLVKNHPNLDWERSLKIANQMHSKKILAIALTMASELCKIPLCPQAKLIFGSYFCSKLTTSFINRMFTSHFNLDLITWYSTIPKCLDNKSDFFRYYHWFATSPSPQLHKGMFNMPGWLYPFFPFIHPFYMVVKYHKSLKKLG